MTETLRLSWHVVVRNWTVYKKDFFANISPTLADPSLIMVSLGLGLGALIQDINGRTYLEFMAPGLVATTALFTSFFESSYGFYVRMTYESIFKAMLTTPVGPREVVMGEYLWNFIKGSLMAFGVTLVLCAFRLVPHYWVLPVATLLGGLISIPCAALGLLASSYIHNINQFQTVYSFLIAPMYFLSGVFFPIEPMPELFQWAIQVSPFAHGVRLMQLLFWGELTLQAVLWHGGMLVAFGVALSYWSNIRIRKKLIA